MVGSLNFTMNGFDDLSNALKSLGPKVARVDGGDAMLDAANEVLVPEAQARVPVDTGALRDSIIAVHAKSDSKDAVTVLIGFNEPAARYAGFVEYGTAKMKPEPFMRPAIDVKGQEYVNVLGQNLGAKLETSAGASAGTVLGGIGGRLSEAVDIAADIVAVAV